MSDVVIKIENVGKQYRLGQVGTGTLSHDLNRWWAKATGKEDPFLKIGEENDRSKKGSSQLVWALKDVSFEVNKGEVLGIIGKNGADKSTLLKIMSQVTSPSVGNIKVKGRIASLLEVGTGFHPELTGKENIYLNGAILGMTKNEIKRKFDEIVDFSGVERYIDTPVKRYSSGMYVRLAFAVAAHLEPEILIVDEVLAVGDAEFQKKCLGKMKDVSGQGRTVLFVSHNLTAVSSLCTRVVYMNNGMVAGVGSPVATIAQYLNDGAERNSFKIWEKENAPGNDKAKLYSAKLINDSKEQIDFISLDKKFGIEFTYELFEDIEDPLPQIHIYTQKEENAFISYGNMKINGIKSAKKGIYKSIVWFPENLFNTGIYYFSIGFVDLEYTQLYFYENNTISIEIIENINEREHNYKGSVGGILRPKLIWNTEELLR